ncbi:MAG: multidrug efflux MFS transporter [Chloroflexi bacterium]|nr:multidrug efflux MFS transporter [Chloroflexota bacterium]
MPHWKRNLIVLSFAQLVTMIGFSAFHPFVAYYMMDLGVPSYTEAMGWMAAFNSGSAIAMMIASPIWGTLADRHGRRMMLIRATGAGCLFAFLMGIAQSPMQLVIVRVIQGMFSGTVAAAVTLVATETPEEYLGRSLGIMQTSQFVGQSIGPLLGGAAADALGYRNVFFMSACLMLVSLITIITLVRERAPRPAPVAKPATPSPSRLKGGMLAAIADRNVMVLVATLAANSFAIAVLSPVLSLYIRDLVGDVPNLSTIAGAVMSVAAFTSSVSAVLLGRLADRIGQRQILIACVIGAALIHVPQALVTHPNQLLVLRGIQGIFMGGIMPTANALLAYATPVARRGAVFGFGHSAGAAGRALGPTLGASVSSIWGMGSAFYVTAGVFGVMAAMVAALVRVAAPAEAEAEAEPSPAEPPAEPPVRRPVHEPVTHAEREEE